MNWILLGGLMEKLLLDNAFSRWRKNNENMSVSQKTMDYLGFQVRLEESIIRIEEMDGLERSSDDL